MQLGGKVVFARFSDLENLTKTHNMHIVEYNGGWWKEHIYFKDYLNGNLKKANEYDVLKQNLATRYPKDEKSYTKEKKRFVDDILKNR